MDNLIGNTYEISYVSDIENYILETMSQIDPRIHTFKGKVTNINDKEITLQHSSGNKKVILLKDIVKCKEGD